MLTNSTANKVRNIILSLNCANLNININYNVLLCFTSKKIMNCSNAFTIETVFGWQTIIVK